MNKIVYTENDKYLISDGEKIQLQDFINGMDIDSISYNFMEYIESQEVCGKHIEDFFVYDNIPLYYFERPTLFMSIKNLIFIFEIIENVCKQYGNEIDVETNSEIMYLISKNVFKLNVTKIGLGSPMVRYSKTKTLINYMARALRGMKYLIKQLFIKYDRETVCAITYAININVVNINGKKLLLDTQLGPLLNKIKNKYNIINLQFLNSPASIEKSLKQNGDYIPYEFFILSKKIKRNKLVISNLLKNDLNLLSQIKYNYKQYDLKDIFLYNILSGIESKYYSELNEILQAEKFLKRRHVKKCITTDEGDRMRCFIIAANRLGIETYAVQHGILNVFCPEYIINTEYKNLVPNKTFVWGEKYKKILVENTNVYNDSNVYPVGQIRTDILFNFYKANKNQNGKIKILYATQFLRDLLEPATEMLFQSLNLLENEYELIIKLHPADKYYDYYNMMVEKNNIKNVEIVKDADIYQLINWCDVVVSVHSTVVVEGALLNKPSICIVLPKYNDAGGFIRDGISMGASSSMELKNELDNILNNDYTGKNNIERYIRENFYKIDGNVVERIDKSLCSIAEE